MLDFFSLKRAAKEAGVPYTTLWYHVRLGQLHPERIDGRWYFRGDQMDSVRRHFGCKPLSDRCLQVPD